MGAINSQFATAFRDYVTAGVPSSGEHNPEKSEIRAIGPLIETALSNIGLGSVNVVKTTKSLLDADLAHAANSTGLVYADSTDANNDLYIKVGSSGTGSWTNTNALHQIMATLAQPYIDELEAAEGLVDDINTLKDFIVKTEEDGCAIVDADGQQFLVFDENGKATLDPSGRLLEFIYNAMPDTQVTQYNHIPAPVNLIQFYGQSLSLGLASIGPISGASPYGNAKMPNSGVQDATWTDGGSGLTGIESLATSIVAFDATVNDHDIEPPIAGAINQLAFNMKYADLIGANSGRGAFGISGLVKGYNGGDGPYALLVDQFLTYSGLVDGRQIRTVICWMQGESDANLSIISRADYKNTLLGIVTNYESDTAQSGAHLATYQISSHTMRDPGYNYNVGLALGELADENADVSLALPMYFLDYVDGVHLTAESSRLAGAYFGKSIDHYFSTGEKFQPFKPLSVSRSGKVITVKFNVPVGNIVVDTESVTNPGNLGFEVFSNTGSLLAISSVDVFGNNAVITLSSTPSNPVEVAYAIGSTLNGQPAGRTSGARGCLRDEDRASAYYDESVKMRNWCVMFKKAEGYGS